MNNQYGYNQYASSYVPPVYSMASQPKTNRILVTGLQEALSKPCDFMSEMYYWDQSRPVIYVVRTNERGVKEWAEIPYIVNKASDSTPATKADLKELWDELSNIKRSLGGPKGPTSGQEVTADVEQSVR